jgi:catechol 2,3-dioxygenase-like lactoylglutathione lyase family enzyme
MRAFAYILMSSIGEGMGPLPWHERTTMTEYIKSMKLNHLSFPSADTAATAAFFERYLGFTVSGTWERCYILKRPGFDVVIDHVEGTAPVWPKAFHAGFELPGLEAVQELYERFRSEGVEMETGVFNNGRGSRFFCRAPGGVMFEINTRQDAAPEYRATFEE